MNRRKFNYIEGTSDTEDYDEEKQPTKTPERRQAEPCQNDKTVDTLQHMAIYYIEGVAKKLSPIFVTVKFDDVTVKMELDSGSPYTFILERLFAEKFGHRKLDKNDVMLKFYTEGTMVPMGKTIRFWVAISWPVLKSASRICTPSHRCPLTKD
jgi:hypothetical protein